MNHTENSCLRIAACIFDLFKSNWYILPFLGQCRILAITFLPLLFQHCCLYSFLTCFKHKILLKLSPTCLIFSLLVIPFCISDLMRSFASLHVSLLYSRWKSLFHLMKYVLRIFFLLHMGFSFFHHHLLIRILFLLNYLCWVLKNSWLYLYRSVSRFFIFFHWLVCLSLVPHSLDYCSLLYCLEIG